MASTSGNDASKQRQLAPGDTRVLTCHVLTVDVLPEAPTTRSRLGLLGPCFKTSQKGCRCSSLTGGSRPLFRWSHAWVATSRLTKLLAASCILRAKCVSPSPLVSCVCYAKKERRAQSREMRCFPMPRSLCQDCRRRAARLRPADATRLTA